MHSVKACRSNVVCCRFFLVAPPNSVSVPFGASVVLRFEIVIASPPVQLRNKIWTYEQDTTINSLSSLNGATISFSTDLLSLTIINVNCNNSGRYELTISNEAGTDSDYIDLYLIGEGIGWSYAIINSYR